MPITPSDSFNLDLSLFGGLVTDIEGSDLPPGTSPACQDMFFQAGNVATRPALSRELTTQLTGTPAVCSVAEFPLAKGGYLTTILDAKGKMWANNPVTNTNTNTDTVTAGVFFKSCNAFDKQFYAFYSPTAFSAFSPNPFVGFDVPRYDNGTGTIQRVTIDAPGAAPTFSNVSFPSFSLVTAPVTGTQSVSSVVGGGKQIIYTPGSGTKSQQIDGEGSSYTPPSYTTIWTTLVYTCTTTVSSTWLGQLVTITGITGTNSSLANTTGLIAAVSGSTFTLNENYSVQVNLTGQSGTATLSAYYLARQNNIVTAFVGTSLPTGIQRGFFASVLASTGLQLNGPTWTITSAIRDTTGLVTVVMSSQLVNLAVGTSMYFSDLTFSASGDVSVTNGSPTITWVSGPTFDQTWVGTAITIASVVYAVIAAYGSSLTLASNITTATNTSVAYTDSVVYIPTGYQTVTQVLATTSTSTTFAFQSQVNIPFTVTSGTAYQVWSPVGGTYGNATQIIGINYDSTNGYSIQWFQLGPDVQFTPGAAPLIQLIPQITPGIRSATVHFISQDGAETAPANTIQISAGSGLSYLSAANIPIGPPGTASRAIDFTPFEGSSFYYIDPAFLPAAGGLGPSITIGTLIGDNTTTQAVLDFSDTQLTSGTQIDITGNNLFAQVVLAPCLGVIEYGERLFWWGEINNIKNFVNMGFDGGYNPPTGTVSVTNNSTSVSWVSGSTFNTNWPANTSIAINGTFYEVASVGSSTALTLTSVFTGVTGTYAETVYSPLGQQPLGWTISGDGLGYLASPTQEDLGFSYVMPSGTNSQISQSAYQDTYAAPIVAPNTTYIFRMRAVAASTLTTGNFIATLTSTTLGSIATATIAGTSIPTTNGWVQATFNGPLAATIPSDLVLEIAVSSTDQTITVDEFEMIPTNQPVLNNQFRVSYVLNPYGYDSVTGLIGIDTAESIVGAFQLRGYLYTLTNESLYESEQNASSEPSGWTINSFATHCGCSGPNAVDSLEDHAWWAGRYGVRSFDGRTMPSKISQYIDSQWNINWGVQTTIWVCNDPVNRQLMVGIPQGTASTPSIVLVMNYRLSDASENPPDPVHISMYSGKMLATDLAQKWCPWNIAANCGALCTRNTSTGLAKVVVVGGGNGLALGSGTTYGEIYSFNFSKYTDDDYGQIHSSYTTYFLFNHDMEQNPLLASHRKLYTYLTIHATGIGKVNVTPYVDAISNGSPVLPLITLASTDPGFDLEWGLNVLGERCAFTIAPTPLTGQTDAYVKLTHLVLAGRQDRLTPVRGSIV